MNMTDFSNRALGVGRGRRRVAAGLLAIVSGLALLSSLVLPGSASASAVGSIDLHNNVAGPGDDCPPSGQYWHFVFAPNDNVTSFETITLNLGTEVVTFTTTDIVVNGNQTDNVFVAVPSGHLLTDLVISGSSATFSGATPQLFNLSSVCTGTSTTTTTTTMPATTTTAPGTTTTMPATTTTAPETTTTTEESTTTLPVTTTTAPGTTTTMPATTTTAPETTTTMPATTTTAPETTTTTAGVGGTSTSTESTTTTQSPSTTTTLAGTTTTIAGATTSNAPSNTAGVAVLGATQTQASGSSGTTGALPVTGANSTLLALFGTALISAGAALMVTGRRLAATR